MSRNRRRFLRDGILGLAATTLAPAAAWPRPVTPRARPVRVRGRVHAGGAGIGRAAISDGLDVVLTDGDGHFELITTDAAEWLRLSTPAGFRIPRSATGTALTHAPLPAGADDVEIEFPLEPLATTDDNHAFLLLADIQTRDAEEMGWFHEQAVPDVLATAAALDADEVFGIACGDIMFDNLGLYGEYERGVARMGLPFFQVVGNHDLDLPSGSDGASTRTFCERFGPNYYSFDRGQVHYVVLDNVLWHGQSYIGYLDDRTLTWLGNDLARVEPGTTVIVAMHIPAFSSAIDRTTWATPEGTSTLNREVLYRLLEPFDAHILSGHTHESEHRVEHGVHEHTHGTVCGAWWTGPICADGTPNGYGVYEVAGSEVRWRYKATGMGADQQITVYPPGADPAAPDEIVANVWNWDPSWTVVWFQDGEPRGPMARRRGFDPRAVELQAGPELPVRSPWVDPFLTDHLFYAPLDPAAREVVVEATDPFGNVFTARL